MLGSGLTGVASATGVTAGLSKAGTGLSKAGVPVGTLSRGLSSVGSGLTSVGSGIASGMGLSPKDGAKEETGEEGPQGDIETGDIKN